MSIPTAEVARDHLRLLGAFISESDLLSERRVDAVGRVIVRFLSKRDGGLASLPELLDATTIAGTPVLKENDIRQAVNLLVRDGVLELVRKKPRTVCLLQPPEPGADDPLEPMFRRVWDQHFVVRTDCDLEDVKLLVSQLFARYGCSAYTTLTSPTTATPVALEALVGEFFASRSEEFRAAFFEGMVAFIGSQDPESAQLKFRIAQSYLFLCWCGTGDWTAEGAAALIEGRKFVLDTNVLFEGLGGASAKFDRLIGTLYGLGASVHVLPETMQEFRQAVTRKADTFISTYPSESYVRFMTKHCVLREPWLMQILDEETPLLAEHIHRACAEQIETVRSILAAHGADFGAVGYDEAEVSTVQATILEVSRRLGSGSKPEVAATHDAIVWLTTQSLGDGATVLTRDRHFRVMSDDGTVPVLMLESVTAVCLSGLLDSNDTAILFSQLLESELLPPSAFASIEELNTMAKFEAILEGAPPHVLQRARREIVDERKKAHLLGQSRQGHLSKRLMVVAADALDVPGKAIDARRLSVMETEVERLRKERGERESSQRETEARFAQQAKSMEQLSASVESLKESLTQVATEKAGAEERLRVSNSHSQDVKAKLGSVEQREADRSAGVLGGLGLCVIGGIVYWLLPILRVPATVAVICGILTCSWYAISPQPGKVSLKIVTLMSGVLAILSFAIEKGPAIINGLQSSATGEPQVESGSTDAKMHEEPGDANRPTERP